MEVPPPTRYARRGETSIAYQAFGEGARTVVGAFGVPSHLDLMWASPAFVRAFRRAASFAHVVIYDSRGVGLSDPVDHVPTLEEQADDLKAVLDDAGLERATLFSSTFTNAACAFFAAQAPERVEALMMHSPFVRSWRQAPHEELVGWRKAAKAAGVGWFGVLEKWGEGGSVAFFAPGLSGERLRREWAMLERASASPAMARALTEAAFRADLGGVLPHIRARTLVVQHADAPNPEEAAREVADLIPRGQFHALASSERFADYAEWLEPLIDCLQELVTGRSADVENHSGVLTTVLFTDVVGSTELAARMGDARWRALWDRYDALLRRHVEAAGGRIVHTAGDGALSEFPGPARAIRCAHGLLGEVAEMGIQIRAGVHTGECERVGSDLVGLAVHIGARVQAAADPGEVWVSRTVCDLVAGSGLGLRARGSRPLKGVPGKWELFSLAAAGAASVPPGARAPRLRTTDRVLLVAARRAPRLLRLIGRAGWST